MALDFKNDNTLLWFLQNDLQRVYRKILYDTAAGKTGLATERSVQDVIRTASELRTLIQDTAQSITREYDEIKSFLEYEERYDSEHGTYYSSIINNISQTALRTIENYDYEEKISSSRVVENALGTIADIANAQVEYRREISSQMIRGFMQDPDYPNDPSKLIFGIAIGQQLKFDAEETASPDGEADTKYYKLDGPQTFGFYTSTGWQFWINGAKVGWFDSDGSRLNVSAIDINNELIHGEWQITTKDSQGVSNGWGIRYIGG